VAGWVSIRSPPIGYEGALAPRGPVLALRLETGSPRGIGHDETAVGTRHRVEDSSGASGRSSDAASSAMARHKGW